MLQVQLKWGLGTFINLFYLSPLSPSLLFLLSPKGLCHKRGLLWPVLNTYSYNLKLPHIHGEDLTANVKDKFVKPWNTICSPTPARKESRGNREREKESARARERAREYVRLKEREKRGRGGGDWKKGRRRVGGEGDVGEEKRKMPPFSTSLQLKWNANSWGEQ